MQFHLASAETRRAVVFYCIFQNGKGFHSILSGVLGQLKIAETMGYTPFIDMELNRTYYSEPHPIRGTKNTWEYYFEPVSSISPKQAYASGEWISSEGLFPFQVMTPFFSELRWLREIYSKYIRLNRTSRNEFDRSKKSVEIGPRVLGVHFRGTDMRTLPLHPMPPSEKQIFKRVDFQLDHSNFDRIFLVTEADSYLKKFQQRYGERLSFSDIPRFGQTDIFVDRPRRNHRYLLGLEALTEMLLLSECGGLISGYSGLSEMAHLLGHKNLSTVSKIWNGTVPTRTILAKHLWIYKSVVPRIFGGFGP